jgi:hypothetical protein
MRQFLIVAGLLLLGACNMVVTKDPLFTAADAHPPQLRQGVWQGLPADKPCHFDQTRAVARWPSCANAFLVTSDKLTSVDEDSAGKPTRSSMAFVLAGGSPAVLQVYNQKDSDASEAAQDKGYVYLGLKPTKTDPQGRVTAFTAWSTLCGPPPPGGAKTSDGENARYGSLTPLEGLTMDKEENNCTTTSQDALRAAAAASEAWAKPDSMIGARWVRDGDR